MSHNPNMHPLVLPAAAVALALGMAGCSEAKHPDTNPTPSSTTEAPAPIEAPQSPIKDIDRATSAGKILLAAIPKGSENHDIFVHDLTTGKNTNLTNTPDADELNPKLSPDKKQVAITGNATGNYQIYRFPLNSPTEMTQLTHSDARNDDPTWVHAGPKATDVEIAYKTSAAGWGDYIQIDQHGGNPRNLTGKHMGATEEWAGTEVPDADGNYKFVMTTRHADDHTVSDEVVKDSSNLAMIDLAQKNAQPRILTDDTNDLGASWYPQPDAKHPGKVTFTFTPENKLTGNDVIKELDTNNAKLGKMPEVTTVMAIKGADVDDATTIDGTLFAVSDMDNGYQLVGKAGDQIVHIPTDGLSDVLSPAGAGTSVKLSVNRN